MPGGFVRWASGSDSRPRRRETHGVHDAGKGTGKGNGKGAGRFSATC